MKSLWNKQGHIIVAPWEKSKRSINHLNMKTLFMKMSALKASEVVVIQSIAWPIGLHSSWECVMFHLAYLTVVFYGVWVLCSEILRMVNPKNILMTILYLNDTLVPVLHVWVPKCESYIQCVIFLIKCNIKISTWVLDYFQLFI